MKSKGVRHHIRVVNGERSTYVIELILEMKKQGWLWTEEFIWQLYQ